MQDPEVYKEAQRRIEMRKHEKSKKMFYAHLMLFFGALTFWFFTLFSGALSLRILIFLMIWILLLVRHGYSVFKLTGVLSEERQRDILELEMDKIQDENEKFDELDLEEQTRIRKEWDDKDLV